MTTSPDIRESECIGMPERDSVLDAQPSERGEASKREESLRERSWSSSSCSCGP